MSLGDITAETLLKGVGDQLVSITLLALYAIQSSKKIKALEDKLTNYVDQDRAKMISVIENNTRVISECLALKERA